MSSTWGARAAFLAALLWTGTAFAQAVTPGGGGGGAVKSVTGSGIISCSPTTGNVVCSGSGSGGTPGGSTNAIQYNAGGGSFGGLAPLTTGQIVIGGASGPGAATTLSGDATLATGGALTIAANAITTGKIAASAVTYAKIQNGSGTNILQSNSGAAPSEATTGTGVLTALGTNVGSAGAFVVNGGALGTPSSGTLTNATGLPISSGVSGLGTGIATWLATPSGANLASALTSALLATKGGTGATSLGSTVNVTAGVFGCTTATTIQLGCVEPDGTTITISGGVISSVGGSATSITPGTTTIVGATAPCLIENSATTTMACPGVGTGVVTALGNAANATGGFGTVGTSGTNVGLLNANKTDSGNNTFSGTDNFSGTFELGGNAFATGGALTIANMTTTGDVAYVSSSGNVGQIAMKAPYIWSVPSNVTVANGTTVIDPSFMWSSGTITSVDYGTNGSTPSFTASVQIGGVNVTGCSSLSVSSSTNTNATCTAANTVSSGNIITLVIASTSGTPDQSWVKINFSHTVN